MNKEIKEKVENKRREIRAEPERLRQRAREIHKCPNCAREVEPRRLYCSDKCSLEFVEKYDYSQNSEILKQYKKELQEEYQNEHPKKETDSMAYLTARKAYKCDFCNTEISKGQKYYKYTVLPGDIDFDDYPFENYRYHFHCYNFIILLFNVDILDFDDYDSDSIGSILYAITLEQNQSYDEFLNNLLSGNFPSKELLEKISDEYQDFEPYVFYESDNSSFKYIYAVKYNADQHLHAEIFESYSEIKNPEEFFKKYYIEERMGDYFEKIISIKYLKIKLPEADVEVKQ